MSVFVAISAVLICTLFAVGDATTNLTVSTSQPVTQRLVNGLADGRLLMTESSALYVLTPGSTTTQRFAGIPSAPGTKVLAPATPVDRGAALFTSVSSVCTLDRNVFFVCDAEGHQLVKVSALPPVASRVLGDGSTDNMAGAIPLSVSVSPHHCAVGRTGFVYVTAIMGSSSARLVKFDASSSSSSATFQIVRDLDTMSPITIDIYRDYLYLASTLQLQRLEINTSSVVALPGDLDGVTSFTLSPNGGHLWAKPSDSADMIQIEMGSLGLSNLSAHSDALFNLTGATFTASGDALYIATSNGIANVTGFGAAVRADFSVRKCTVTVCEYCEGDRCTDITGSGNNPGDSSSSTFASQAVLITIACLVFLALLATGVVLSTKAAPGEDEAEDTKTGGEEDGEELQQVVPSATDTSETNQTVESEPSVPTIRRNKTIATAVAAKPTNPEARKPSLTRKPRKDANPIGADELTAETTTTNSMPSTEQMDSMVPLAPEDISVAAGTFTNAAGGQQPAAQVKNVPPPAAASELASSTEDGPAGSVLLIVDRQRSNRHADQPVEPPIHFRRGRAIGRGAFGTVYEGLDENSGTMLAAKEIVLAGIPERQVAQQIASFRREIAAMRTLDHPNVINTYGGVQHESSYYIIMELCPSGSLRSVIERFGSLPPKAARSYTQQLLHAVAHVHERGIVHRDIKSMNCLINTDGALKLIDFGASRNEATATGQSGTACWVAPEIMRGHDVTKASDIWSIGCTVIEMMTGDAPFLPQLRTVAAVMVHVIGNDPLEIPDLGNAAAQSFVDACLVRDHKRRPTAEELLQHPFCRDGTLDESVSSPHSPLPPARKSLVF